MLLILLHTQAWYGGEVSGNPLLIKNVVIISLSLSSCCTTKIVTKLRNIVEHEIKNNGQTNLSIEMPYAKYGAQYVIGIKHLAYILS